MEYYKQRKEIHDRHFYARSKDGPAYLGFDSWMPEEQTWAERGKAELNILAKNLKLTSKERREIQNGVVVEVDNSVGKEQHP